MTDIDEILQYAKILNIDLYAESFIKLAYEENYDDNTMKAICAVFKTISEKKTEYNE